ncbi:MAG: hypothetical protein H6684_03965 [Deltaproteobacteria bacterium]|nr:hypothetical protein [bacterium]MCB9487869.1 hypothetical protein [Deltaproteobacteria bacterium]
MQAVFIIISEADRLQDVLTGLLEVGITTATIIESQGMGRAVMDNLSIFAGFRDLWSGNLSYNHTLFTVVDDEKVEELIPVVKDILAPGDSPSKGVLFTLPVARLVKFTPSKED